jgi:hypothetical protein
MKFEKGLTISNKENLSFEVLLTGSLEGDVARLDLSSSSLNLLNVVDQDFWGCLLKVRQDLERKNLFILCQGSAINVRPSGMARDMSSGLKAYAFELGKKVTMKNLVEVFEPINIEMVATIAEQEQFFMKWIEQPRT